MKLKAKFGIPVSISLMVVVMLSGLFSYLLVTELVDRQRELVERKKAEEMEAEVNDTIRRLYADIDAVGSNAIKMASLFSSLPEVLDAYESALTGNIDDEADPVVQNARQRIRSVIRPAIDKLKADTGMAELKLHYHLPNSRSFVRVWRKGWQTIRDGKKIDVSDDLSSFRKTVVAINRGDHEPIHGIEVGRGGFVIRGLASIALKDGTSAGSNEILMSFDSVLRRINEGDSSHFAVYMDSALLPIATRLQDGVKYPVLDGRYVLTTATDRGITDPMIDTGFLDRGRREPFSKTVDNVYLTALPIFEYSGKSAGVVVLVRDISSHIRLLTEAREMGERISNRLFWVIAGAVLFTFLLIYILLAILMNRIVLRPLQQSLDFADTVSRGDFTRLLEIDRKDEIGFLVEAFNKIVKSFNQVFIRISSNIVGLSSTSNELNSISQQMLKSSENSADNAQSVAGATEAMSATMNSVAAAGEEASVNIHSLSDVASQLNDTIGDIARNTKRAGTIVDKAVDLVASSSEKVDALGLAAESIGEVTEVISTVSEKTDLLALNATIEAARAGEAGKGFAVVANEIKTLANQTADSTQEIRQKINDIQNSTDSTVAEIKQITDVIAEVNDIVSSISSAVDEQARSTGEIAENVGQAALGIDEVARNVAQSSTAATEIAGDIGQVSQAAGDFAANSSQINSNAEDLSQIANGLRDMLAMFRTSAQLEDAVETETGGAGGRTVEPLMIWQDGYSIHMDEIDRQHRRLVELINELHAGMKKGENRESLGKTFDSLVEYTARHFGYEEKLFTQYGYPEYQAHKTAHEKLVEKVLDFKTRFENNEAFVSMELMAFLKDWLVKHIQGTDKKYAPFLIEKMGNDKDGPVV